MCKGCGTCVAACPAGVITGAHFNNEQIFAEIDGILWDAKPRTANADGKLQNCRLQNERELITLSDTEGGK